MSEDLVNNVQAAEAAINAIGGKWKIAIVACLDAGPVRFSELRRRMPAISQQSLATQLRELERDGIVSRSVVRGAPLRVDYALTEIGQTVSTVMASFVAFGGQILQRRSEKYDVAESCDVRLDR